MKDTPRSTPVRSGARTQSVHGAVKLASSAHQGSAVASSIAILAALSARAVDYPDGSLDIPLRSARRRAVAERRILLRTHLSLRGSASPLELRVDSVRAGSRCRYRTHRRPRRSHHVCARARIDCPRDCIARSSASCRRASPRGLRRDMRSLIRPFPASRRSAPAPLRFARSCAASVGLSRAIAMRPSAVHDAANQPCCFAIEAASDAPSGARLLVLLAHSDRRPRSGRPCDEA